MIPFQSIVFSSFLVGIQVHLKDLGSPYAGSWIIPGPNKRLSLIVQKDSILIVSCTVESEAHT